MRSEIGAVAAIRMAIGTCCVLFVVTHAGWGQSRAQEGKDSESLRGRSEADLDPAAFEQWVVKTCDEKYAARGEPSTITDAILKRLREGRFVTDKAVMYGIGAWTGYEGLAAQGDSARKHDRYEKTIAMIDKIDALLYARPWLRARLRMKKADLFRLEDKTAEAVASRQAAMAELESLNEELSMDRMENMTVLGETLFSQSKKKEAEAVFLDVLSFPWYLIAAPEPFQLLRDRYIRSGRGVIDCRRGDLHALQGTYFVPSALRELGPYLDDALVEAGGKPRGESDRDMNAPARRAREKPKR